MKDSYKLMLLGLGVKLFASGWGEDGLATTLSQPDPVKRVRDLHRSQALSVLGLVGDGMFWFGAYKEAPKLTIGVGVAATALAYAPRVMQKVDPEGWSATQRTPAGGYDHATSGLWDFLSPPPPPPPSVVVTQVAHPYDLEAQALERDGITAANYNRWIVLLEQMLVAGDPRAHRALRKIGELSLSSTSAELVLKAIDSFIAAHPSVAMMTENTRTSGDAGADGYVAAYVQRWNAGDPFFIAQIQKVLGVMTDGVVGARTVSALRALQQRAGLAPTGQMTLSTMQWIVDGNS